MAWMLLQFSCKHPENPAVASGPLVYPAYYPTPIIPSDNPITVEKVYLGRMLFYETEISEDHLIACATCHKQKFAFGDSTTLNIKVHHGSTTRNTSVLYNLAFTKSFFWDGRQTTLENTCQDAMLGEMNFDINFVKSRLMSKTIYQQYFKSVYNTTDPTQDMVVKALATFIRTMVSANSRMDQGLKEGNSEKYLSASEIIGKKMFDNEDADCFHCHGNSDGVPLLTDNLFHNNGIDNFSSISQYKDIGLGKITNNTLDYGKFKTPSLRNIAFSAPYMHDGRFATLDDVLNHYNTNIHNSVNIDPGMTLVYKGGMQLSPDRLVHLKNFLLSLSDYTFIKDTSFSNPFK